MKWEVKIQRQGETIGINYTWARTAIDAINQVEHKVNPLNSEGKRKYFFCYEAKQVNTLELS